MFTLAIKKRRKCTGRNNHFQFREVAEQKNNTIGHFSYALSLSRHSRRICDSYRYYSFFVFWGPHYDQLLHFARLFLRLQKLWISCNGFGLPFDAMDDMAKIICVCVSVYRSPCTHAINQYHISSERNNSGQQKKNVLLQNLLANIYIHILCDTVFVYISHIFWLSSVAWSDHASFQRNIHNVFPVKFTSILDYLTPECFIIDIVQSSSV